MREQRCSRALVREVTLHFRKVPLASKWRMGWKGARVEEAGLVRRLWQDPEEMVEVCTRWKWK